MFDFLQNILFFGCQSVLK